uniref:AAA+ ATPase domain-containing protein n=1 Tax=Hemiselmis andersenii TaxID=464988 RepID=A0A7S1EFY0_HEMAN
MEVEEEETKVPVYVEAETLASSRAARADLLERVGHFMVSSMSSYKDGAVDFSGDEFLRQNLKALAVTDLVMGGKTANGEVPLWQAALQVRLFQCSDEGVCEETEGDTTSCNIWTLPAVEFRDLWDTLVYDSEVKSHLLEYATSAMYFADKGVNASVVSWNRVVLLHGPPGTGKTSLCQALAQKLSIRMSDRFSFGQLVEVNAHSLFSKWFSESGKLVNKLFATIQELIDDPQCFVVVLIDEVESLTAARKSAVNGNEPSDAIRVVNALLTQIDQLKQFKNVMVMTTSNITEAIDLAFVDRADIKQYIGLPSPAARYQILASCVQELMRVSIINPPVLLKAAHLLPQELLSVQSPDQLRGNHDPTALLYACALQCETLSGRTLRKLPFLAHAIKVQQKSVSFATYCDALAKVAVQERQARTKGGLEQQKAHA